MSKQNRYRIRNRARNNPFSVLSGIEAFEMEGGSGCTIIKSKNYQIQAFCLYNELSEISPKLKIIPSCGVKNCVKKEHLIATYQPTKKDAEYIKDYLKIDGAEYLSHTLNVPIGVFEEYIKTI